MVTGDRVAELTWPLLLAYMHSAEAATRWERINADGSRVVMVLRPASRKIGRASCRERV